MHDDLGARREDHTLTIKCGLRSSLKMDALLPEIEAAVLYVSKLVVRGSRLVNGFLVSSYTSGRAVDLSTQNARERFIRQTFTLGFPGKGAVQEVPELAGWYAINKDNYEVISAEDIPQNRKEISDYAFGTYLTSFENNIWTNYDSRLYKYLIARFGEERARVIRDRVVRGTKDVVVDDLTDDEKMTVSVERRAFGIDDNDATSFITETKKKRHLGDLMERSFHHLNAVNAFNDNLPPRSSEGPVDEDDKLRTWTLAPLAHRKRHNITIDTNVLMLMMKRCGKLDKKTTFDAFWDVAPDHFASIFEVRRPDDPNNRRRHSHGASKQFVHRCYVQTDGVVLNAQFQPASKGRIKGGSRALKKQKFQEATAARQSNGTVGSDVPKNTMSAKAARAKARRDAVCSRGEVPDDVELFACDPGRANIMYINRLSDKKKYRLTRGQFQRDGGVLSSRNAWTKWNQPLQTHYAALASNSPKVTSVGAWDAFMKIDTAIAPEMWTVNYARRASRMRFHTYCKKKQCLQKFLASLGKGLGSDVERKRRVLVGYGHARFSASGKGEMAVPVTDAFKTCAQMWNTRIVNEHYTSVVCADCDGRLVNVKCRRRNKEGVFRKVDNRALHRCTNVCKTVGLSLKHRDGNAAVNIGKIFSATLAGLPRPAIYTKNDAPPKPQTTLV